MEAPALYPPPWTRRELRTRDDGRIGSLLHHAYGADTPFAGLQATYAVETYPAGTDAPLGQPGRYRRLVLSRTGDDRYPTWDEMRDLVRTCGFFDRSRDVFMLLPPDAEYVNIRKTAFHWWQRDTDGQ